MPDTRQRFSGSKIRQARLSAGFTQAALARAINTRERNIIRWENDQHAPRFEHIAAIAKATGKPLEFFAAAPEESESSEDDDEEPDLAFNLFHRAVRAVVLEVLQDEIRKAA